MVGWLVGWLVDCLSVCLCVCLVGWLIDVLVDCVFVFVFGWLFVCLVGWLVGELVGEVEGKGQSPVAAPSEQAGRGARGVFLSLPHTPHEHTSGAAARATAQALRTFAPRRITQRVPELRAVPIGTLLNLQPTSSQKCEAVPVRARI